MDYRAAILGGGFALIAGALAVVGVSQQIGLAFLLIGSALVLWGLLKAYQERQRRRHPDFPKWDQRQSFQLWEAACLWAGQEPNQPLSWRARRRFQQLTQAVREKKLIVLQHNAREAVVWGIDLRRGRKAKPDPTWTVSRDDLRSYAVGAGEKPPFLFPKERIR